MSTGAGTLNPMDHTTGVEDMSLAACQDVDPAQTLQVWRSVGALVSKSGSAAIAVLEASGVPRDDLALYARTIWPDMDVDGTAAWALALDLLALADHFPQMSVHSGIGWSLLSAHRNGEVMDNYVTVLAAQPWHDAGLGERGWLFEAAGMGMVEAQNVVRSGALHVWASLRTMAALRGMPLPVG